MTKEEQKKADDTAKAEAEAKAEEDADADSQEDSSDNDNEIDYEAELAKEREAREKAEKALAEKRFNTSKKRRQEKPEEGEEDEGGEKPLSESRLKEILDEDREQNKMEFERTRAEDIAKKYGKSDSERKLILEIHRNRRFPSHLSLEDQIEESYVIANRKKIIGENAELKRALKGKDGANDDSSNAHHESMKGTAPKLPAGDEVSYKRAGFVYDTKDKVWKKKLASGKYLIKDPVSKKTYLK